jgi:hypothetical protein
MSRRPGVVGYERQHACDDLRSFLVPVSLSLKVVWQLEQHREDREVIRPGSGEKAIAHGSMLFWFG